MAEKRKSRPSYNLQSNVQRFGTASTRRKAAGASNDVDADYSEFDRESYDLESDTEPIPQSVGTEDWYVITREMPGGPVDCSLIPSYGGHVARWIWDGIERSMLSGYARPDSCRALKNALGKMKPEALEIVKASGLGHLPHIIYSELDMPLISAFVERCQPDANTFHLPFGEMTILLHDVWFIMRVPVGGELPYDEPSKQIDQEFTAKTWLRRLFQHENEVVFQNAKRYFKGGVDVNTLVGLAENPNSDPTTQSAAWLLAATGVCLLTDKYRTHVKGHHFSNILANKPSNTSWAAMTLAFLYRQLGQASRFECSGIAGCLTLLQAWIYEHFHCFRPSRDRLPINFDDARAASWRVHKEKKDSERLIALRQRLDIMQADEVTWCPYGPDPTSTCKRTIYHGCIGYYDIAEPYMPDRCLRQLGYVQKVPMIALTPISAIRPIRVSSYVVRFPRNVLHEWELFGGRNSMKMDNYTRCTRPDEADESYLLWYIPKAHPRLTPPTISLLDTQVEQPSPDWFAHEFYRLASVLTPLPPEQVGLTPQWRELAALVDQYGNIMRFHNG